MGEKSSEKIFSGVKYFVSGVLSDDVSFLNAGLKSLGKTRALLDNGGAQKINFFSDAVTHCIVGENPRETDISDAKELYEVPAVTPYWVLLSVHCSKALPPKGFLFDTKHVFYGLKMTASFVSLADYKALWAMVTFYGGTFQSKLTRNCTHLIAGRASGAKYEAALKSDSIKIVTPDWIVESVNLGRRPEEPFHPKHLMVPKAKEPTPPPAGNLSTAQILGFADDVVPATSISEGVLSGQTPPESAQALLEKLKQRMPWNQSTPAVSTPPQNQPTAIVAPTKPLPLPIGSQPTTQLPQQPISHPIQQSQQLQQQPQPIQRMVPPQMIMRPQQSQQMSQAAPGQMKQFRLVHRDMNTMHQTRMEMAPGQVLLQQPQPQPQQQQQQQMIQQQQVVETQTQMQPIQQQTILQGPGLAMQQGMQIQGAGPRQVAWQQAPQKQVIQLDAQTHQQLSQMEPQQKMLFLQRIHQRQMMQQRHLQIQQQQAQQQQQQQVQVQVQQKQVIQQQVVQQRPQVPVQAGQQVALSGQQVALGGQQVALGGVPMQMRQQPSIIVRGLTPQQQTAWIQQQQFLRQQQQMLVQQQQGAQMRQGVPQRVMQQQTATATWIPQQDGTVTQPTQQQIHQMQLQRQQQIRMHQMKHQVVIQRTPGPIQQQFTQVSQVPQSPGQAVAALQQDDSGSVDGVTGGGGILVNNRTKTALANMLSSRLHTGHLSPQSQQQVMGVAADGTAAGQLRLMSAQQRAPQPPPQLTDQKPVTPGPGVMYSPQQAPQQRRTLGNITNATAVGVVGVVPTQGPKSPARVPLASPAPAPPASATPKPQYFTHNPNLRIPLEKYLIGCVFYVVEYDKFDASDVNIPAWEEIIREHGGEVESNYTPRVTHVLCETQKHGIVQQALRDGKRCITAFWLNDVVTKGSMSIPWLALHFPVPFGKEKPLSKYHMSLTGFEDRSERERVALMISVAGGQYRSYFSPVTQILICKRPEGAKYRKAKELGKITVNVHWLNEVLLGHYSCIQQPELHKYQQYNITGIFRVDYSLLPHLMAAWKIPISMTPEAYTTIKNSPMPPQRAKRPRLDLTVEQAREMESKVLDSVPVINIELLTMEARPWIAITGDKNLEYSKKAKQLGCFLVKSFSKVTHLVVCGQPVRTVKFLTALITCKYVLRETWLTDSAAQNKLLPESPYQIMSIDVTDFKCNLTRVLSSPERNLLMKDKIFYMTPSVFPSRRDLSEMIELSGGRVEKQRRSVKAIKELNSITPTYFVISCFNDIQLISDLFRAKIDFYHAELIMRAITTQIFDPGSAVYKC